MIPKSEATLGAGLMVLFQKGQEDGFLVVASPKVTSWVFNPATDSKVNSFVNDICKGDNWIDSMGIDDFELRGMVASGPETLIYGQMKSDGVNVWFCKSDGATVSLSDPIPRQRLVQVLTTGKPDEFVENIRWEKRSDAKRKGQSAP